MGKISHGYKLLGILSLGRKSEKTPSTIWNYAEHNSYGTKCKGTIIKAMADACRVSTTRSTFVLDERSCETVSKGADRKAFSSLSNGWHVHIFLPNEM